MAALPDKPEEEDFAGEHNVVRLFFLGLAGVLGFLIVLVVASLVSGSWLPLLLADLLFRHAYVILGALVVLVVLAHKVQSAKAKRLPK